MAGYIFVSPGSDPGVGKPLNDPILGKGVRPTMGTCRPDLRRLVNIGDSIFVISGSMGRLHIPQYVVGGMEVAKKLASQLAAYDAYPEHRLSFDDNGVRSGNIIVQADGRHDPRDNHDKFDSRINNYLLGKNQIVMESPDEVALARDRSLRLLVRIFEMPKARSIREIVPRHRKLSDAQVEMLRSSLLDLKREAKHVSR